MSDPRNTPTEEPVTHFGYKSVPESQKAEKVAEVFHSVAAKYDLMNDLMSGGIHRLWKRFTIELSGARPGNRILDIAGGTGDLTRQFSRLVGPTGEVVLADINASMLKVGRDRLLDNGAAGNIRFVQADAEKLPFPDNHFNVVTIAFGLRNVTHKEDAIASMLRVLKPGGRLLVLEFSKPTNPLFAKAYDAYSFSLLPLMGKLITNDSESYRYLAESIRMHPDQDTLKAMMVTAGFDRVTYHNMTGGVVALHRGIKP
ncbi:bifunctional demethylmenaquinone methyltransferase/2-methoxy-6-polyprenyl-1,4-benzoquinol methylase UbiE [Stutzerimonas urumqiensis]|uniref:bifunctional demethylmenaquinone methyltransferase/2-methoxy-6-polyprenyl-1,4-benzoquinol methylase UbiE n=1 Tax=Stutzerimonas urumqiensis TaxID=638269 RepID=UPI000EB0CC2B|nr:bifunctional demethylmenaquinone methyltransferase/2-methoxy-6-polyprenyl-1,4-benzoquinol methylase UbiE [Stutzerimonas urumqiensis]